MFFFCCSGTSIHEDLYVRTHVSLELILSLGNNLSRLFFSISDRRINFNEFLPILKEVAKNRDASQPADFIEGFKVFDKEQNGTIGTAELRHLLSTLGEYTTSYVSHSDLHRDS